MRKLERLMVSVLRRRWPGRSRHFYVTALRRAATVRRVARDAWLVPGRSTVRGGRRGEYDNYVWLSGGELHCTCRYRFGGHRRDPCTHVAAVQLHLSTITAAVIEVEGCSPRVLARGNTSSRTYEQCRPAPGTCSAGGVQWPRQRCVFVVPCTGTIEIEVEVDGEKRRVSAVCGPVPLAALLYHA